MAQPQSYPPQQPPSYPSTGSGGRASSATRDAPLDPQGLATGRAVSHRGGAAGPLPAATRPTPPGAVAGREGPTSMGRGASRGREAREPTVVTRPSPDFNKKGAKF